MAKGDDSIQKKKNKATRKKLNRKESPAAAVSARVAAIIAAKKRRQTGKRSMCQGMCFTLPSLDDPFNDRKGKKEILFKKKAKKVTKDKRATQEEKKKKNDSSKDVKEVIALRDRTCGSKKKTEQQLQGGCPWDSDCPSKFLMLCLKTIEKSLLTDDDGARTPLFLNSWGIEFWKLYETGRDFLLETTSEGVSSSTEQISWIVSTAADSIAKKEKEDLSFTTPFLLYLVPTSEKCAEVRSVCKYLKALGVHIVSIHCGASLDHQIQGLKSCEPEFMVSTAERLLELISVKAVDVSGISLLVVDGRGCTSEEGRFHEAVKSIRKCISGNPHTIVFKDGVGSLRDLLRRE